MHTEFLLEILKGRDQTEDLGVDGKILDLILGKRGQKLWTDRGPTTGSCEHGSVPLGFTEDGEFLE